MVSLSIHQTASVLANMNVVKNIHTGYLNDVTVMYIYEILALTANKRENDPVCLTRESTDVLLTCLCFRHDKSVSILVKCH